jgi:hypothetical protein
MLGRRWQVPGGLLWPCRAQKSLYKLLLELVNFSGLPTALLLVLFEYVVAVLKRLLLLLLLFNNE